MTPCQRWNNRRDSYRPAGEPIRTADYEVAAIPDDTTAKAFVMGHHYSGSYPAARERFGLYRAGSLVGVAVFSVPANSRAITTCLPGEANDSVELGRFVLLDDVPANGESWFLARCFAELRTAGYLGVISFSDPVARTRADGGTIFGGHLGIIYQATNAVYVGRGTARTLRLLPDGTVWSARAAQKARSGDRGWRYACAQLEAAGATPAPEADDSRRAWVREWTDSLTRTLRHPGNHKYCWALDRAARRHLPASLAYPKALAA